MEPDPTPAEDRTVCPQSYLWLRSRSHWACGCALPFLPWASSAAALVTPSLRSSVSFGHGAKSSLAVEPRHLHRAPDPSPLTRTAGWLNADCAPTPRISVRPPSTLGGRHGSQPHSAEEKTEAVNEQESQSARAEPCGLRQVPVPSGSPRALICKMGPPPSSQGYGGNSEGSGKESALCPDLLTGSFPSSRLKTEALTPARPPTHRAGRSHCDGGHVLGVQ